MAQVLKKSLVLVAGCFSVLGAGAVVANAHPKMPVAPTASAELTKTKALDFIENKGQWGHGIRYMSDVPGGTFFLTNNGFVYNFVRASDMQRYGEELEDGKPITPNGLHYHAYKVNFVGGNVPEKITNSGFDKRSYYHNYFIDNDHSKWKGHVGLYGKVKLGNVYNGIDAYVYSSVSGDKVSLKYDFVVAAGTKASTIQLSFDGVSPEINKDGALVIKTTVNEIVEQAPYCYQEINGQKVEVASKYVLNNGQLSFRFPNDYNHNYPLVIDPNLIFATYSGGTGGSYYAHSTTYDTLGNTYGAALADGDGWPTTIGAYQTTFPGSGSNTVAINKYNPLGSQLLYSTYFGTSGNAVMPNTLRVNADGDLYVAGSTDASNLPMTSGAYQSTLAGGNDIYLAKFTPDGSTLLASTFIGGTGNDASQIGQSAAYTYLGTGANPVEIAFDTLGNVWVTSNSSSIDFPTTTNAAQNYLGGGTDAVVFKLNGNLSSLLYSTYVGGSGWDGGISIEMDPDDNPVFAGMTKSIDFPTTSAAYYSYSQGQEDGFVARINPMTGAISEATYLGTDNQDAAMRVAFDLDGNVYVAGSTVGAYPVSSGAWNCQNGSVFIQKLSSDLSTAIKSTTIGIHVSSYSSIIPSGFMVDRCGNMVIGLMTSNTPQTGLELTPDAFQTSASSFYLAIVSRDFNSLLFGSYYGTGSDHFHPGISRLDKNGVFYQSVCSAVNNFPTTPNAYAPNKLSSSLDLITFKFQFPPTGVQAHIQAASGGKDTVGCAPYTLHLGDASTSPYGITYTWDPGDGTPVIHTSDFNHTFTNPGTYTIVLNAHSDSACVTDDYDSFHVTVVAVDLPQITASADTLLCNQETSISLWVQIHNPSSNNSIEWWPTNGVISGGASDTALVDPTINTYYVRVRDSIQGLCGFSAVDTIHIDFFPRALTINTNDTTVCKGTQVQVDAQSAQGYTFLWSPINGVNDSTAINPVITANETMTYTLTAHHPGCLDTAQTLTINVQDYPKVDLGPDLEFCEWSEVPLTANVTPYRNDYTYEWRPASVGTNFPNSPNAQVTADTSGWYYLTVTAPVGCSGSDSVHLTVFPGNFGAVSADTGYCLPNQVQLWAAGASKYKWTPAFGLNDTTIADPIAEPVSTTDYTVYMVDVHGCKDTGNVTVTVYPSATLTLPDSITVYSGESYHLEPATNCVYFNWFPTNGVNSTLVSDPVFNPSVRTRYFVTAKTENGCIVTDSMDVLVEGTAINMANAFTPGIGANGTYKVSKRGIANLKEFAIYNRWGNKVFSTTNIDEGWDGSYNGKPQPTGVYIYTVEAVTNAGQPVVKRGNVTLIR